MIISTFDKLSLNKTKAITIGPSGYLPACPSWSFSRAEGFEIPPTTGSDPREEEAFNRALIKGYELLYEDPEEATECYKVSQMHLSKISDASADEGINIGERDVAEKFSIQRRLPPKFFATDKFLPHGSYTEDFDFCLEAYVKKMAGISKVLAADPISIMLADEDPFDTNQGYPTFSTDPEKRFMTAQALSIPRYSKTDILSSIDRMNRNIGMDEMLRWPAAIAKRTGPTHKPVSVFRDHADGYSIISDYEATGYFTRARKVYMMPFYFNMIISPVALALKRSRTSILGFGHDAIGEAGYLKAFAEGPDDEICESDLSGFDTSITPALRLRFWYWCEKYGFNSITTSLLREFEQSTVVLSAPYNSKQRGTVSYFNDNTGLLSGLKITTEMGSGISGASTLKAMMRCGAVTRDQIASGNWPLFLLLGDDVLLKVKKGTLDPDVFEGSYAEEGLKVKLLQGGKRFLMNHVTKGKKWGVASRLIQQTLFNEDSYSHIGQMYLGMASRLSKDYLPEHWTLITSWINDMAAILDRPDSPFVLLKGVTGRAEAMKILLARKEVNEFLLSAEGESWLARIYDLNAMNNKFDDLLRMVGARNPMALPGAVEQRRALVSSLFNSNPTIHRKALLGISNHLQGIKEA